MKRILLALSLLLILFPTQKVKAGYLNGDEALGGFSYMMELAYANTVPEEENYGRLFYQAYMTFHYDYVITDEERAILERIVEAEATGGNIEQKMNVASCILARVESSKWADTIEGVVFEHYGNIYQFTPIVDGRYYSVKIVESTRQAVDRVLKYGKTHDCTWFCSDGSYNKKDKNGKYISYHRNHHTWVFFDGEHHYFND